MRCLQRCVPQYFRFRVQLQQLTIDQSQYNPTTNVGIQNLEKVGVYGYVNDAVSAESVLANNPDSGTDAGQFAMIENVSTSDKKIEFEFIAAVPKEKV